MVRVLIVSVLVCAWLVVNLPVDTWIRFAIWLIVGLVSYFVSGQQHSRVQNEASEAPEPAEA